MNRTQEPLDCSILPWQGFTMATCGGCGRGWRGDGARRPYRESDVAYVALPPRAVVLRRSSDALFFPAASRHASVLVAPHARAVDGHVSVLDTRRRGARSDLDGRAQRQRHGGLDYILFLTKRMCLSEVAQCTTPASAKSREPNCTTRT